MVKELEKQKPDENRCNNCHLWLDKDYVYCPECGTKRGEGKFVPSDNYGIILYGSEIAFFYKCKKCKHIWRIVGMYDGDGGHFCPKCGTPKAMCYYELDGVFDGRYQYVKEPTFSQKLKYKIKKIKRMIRSILKK